MVDSDKHLFMHKAIQLSKEGVSQGAGGPFGAIVVKEGKIIGQAYNQVIQQSDPTAHAEVGAIRKACLNLNHFHLEGCELFTSCEPCPMCLSAAYWARIDKIWYACTRHDAAEYGFDDAHIYEQINLAHSDRALNIHQMLRGEAIQVFEYWKKLPDHQLY